MRSYNTYSMEQRITNLEKNGGAGEVIAAGVSYDNRESDLLANNVQDAIDEVLEIAQQGGGGGATTAEQVSYDNVSGAIPGTVTNCQRAIYTLANLSASQQLTNAQVENRLRVLAYGSAETGALENGIGWYIKFGSGLLIQSELVTVDNIVFESSPVTGMYQSYGVTLNDYESDKRYMSGTPVERYVDIVKEGLDSDFCWVGSHYAADSGDRQGRVKLLSLNGSARSKTFSVLSIGYAAE